MSVFALFHADEGNDTFGDLTTRARSELKNRLCREEPLMINVTKASSYSMLTTTQFSFFLVPLPFYSQDWAPAELQSAASESPRPTKRSMAFGFLKKANKRSGQKSSKRHVSLSLLSLLCARHSESLRYL